MIETDTWLHQNAQTLGIDPSCINPHSADVRLGSKIIEMQDGQPDRIHTLQPGQVFTFEPGKFYLAETLEELRIPVTHRAQILLKSSTARKGLNHLMAGYLDAGFIGVVTLEFVAHITGTFQQGQRIMQVEFAKLSGVPEKPYSVTGRYMNQKGVQKAIPDSEVVK